MMTLLSENHRAGVPGNSSAAAPFHGDSLRALVETMDTNCSVSVDRYVPGDLTSILDEPLPSLNWLSSCSLDAFCGPASSTEADLPSEFLRGLADDDPFESLFADDVLSLASPTAYHYDGNQSPFNTSPAGTPPSSPFLSHQRHQLVFGDAPDFGSTAPDDDGAQPRQVPFQPLQQHPQRQHKPGGGGSSKQKSQASKHQAAATAGKAKRKPKDSGVPQEPSHPKPPLSFPCLIGLAMKNFPGGKMAVADIYDYILTRFPYFRTAKAGWKNSIRHNLSLNKFFMKAERPKDENGKGSLWCVSPGLQDQLDRDVRNSAQRNPLKLRNSEGCLDLNGNKVDRPSDTLLKPLPGAAAAAAHQHKGRQVAPPPAQQQQQRVAAAHQQQQHQHQPPQAAAAAAAVFRAPALPADLPSARLAPASLPTHAYGTRHRVRAASSFDLRAAAPPPQLQHSQSVAAFPGFQQAHKDPRLSDAFVGMDEEADPMSISPVPIQHSHSLPNVAEAAARSRRLHAHGLQQPGSPVHFASSPALMAPHAFAASAASDAQQHQQQPAGGQWMATS